MRYGMRSLLLLTFVALPALLSAQDSRTVTGQVREAESNQPLPGVRVTAKGTMLGTVTGSDGRFTLRVPPSVTTLTFAAIGRKTVDVPVQDVVEVSLERQAIMLEGVVTTALGIEREGRELAAAAQVLQNADVTQTPDPNFVNTLQGKVAGVQIINAGPTGGTSRIVIRGASSLIGNNQPLFVVDGIPIDNSAAGAGYSRNQGFGGIDYGNAAQDIDPNNVESVTILKGPNAAALYGSRAQNGAIVITTKSGRGGALGISVSSSVTAETPLRLPQYQNVYGQGFDGLFQWSDGYGGGGNEDAGEDWG